MAGDWIKMRSDLFTHPKVVRMASALKADTLRTVGGLMSAWCLFDAHSEDGSLPGYTPETLDDHLRWPGFAAAMIAVKWLNFTPHEEGGTLALPEFETHNGQGAKRRAQDADRKRSVRKMSASKADTKRTREEKRREEIEASLSPARAGEDNPTEVIVTDGDGNPYASAIAELTYGQSAHLVKACQALRKMGAQQFHPGDDRLASIFRDQFTAEQVVRAAGEKALRDAALWDDPDLSPNLLELLINGGTQRDMGLTDKQHVALRSAVSQVSIGYVAAALRGRRRDAITPTGTTHANQAIQRGPGGRGNSAVERVRAANAAAEQRELGG